MKKIIQISVGNDETIYCLTEDGKVYERRVKDSHKIIEERSEKFPNGRIYTKGISYWKEILEEESF